MKKSRNSAPLANRSTTSRSRTRDDVGHPVAEQLAHVRLVAPQRRRLRTGRRRRRVGLHGREHPADEALRRPAEQADPATGAYDAHQLVGGVLVPRREHHADARDRRVELAVVVRQRLGVVGAPVQVEALGLGGRGGRRRAAAGVMSEATTSAPVRAAGSAALPVPAATSRTCWPAPMPVASTRRGSERGDQLGGDGVVVAESPERSGVSELSVVMTRASARRAPRPPVPALNHRGSRSVLVPTALAGRLLVVGAREVRDVVLRTVLPGGEGDGGARRALDAARRARADGRAARTSTSCGGATRRCRRRCSPSGCARLERAGVVRRDEVDGRTSYHLTACGMELKPVVEGLGAWGIRWIGELGEDDLDPHLLLWDIRRTVPLDAWPRRRTVVRVRVHRPAAPAPRVVAVRQRRRRRRVRLRPGLRRHRHGRHDAVDDGAALARRPHLGRTRCAPATSGSTRPPTYGVQVPAWLGQMSLGAVPHPMRA